MKKDYQKPESKEILVDELEIICRSGGSSIGGNDEDNPGADYVPPAKGTTGDDFGDDGDFGW